MDLEKARAFASEQRDTIEKIKDYTPGETGHESQSNRQRFNGLWERLDELATKDPRYDGLDRSKITVRDSADLTLEISRHVNIVDRSDYRDSWKEKIRTISSTYIGPSGHIMHTESLNDQYIDTYMHAKEFLGLLEETEQGVAQIFEEQEERRRLNSGLGYRIEGHP